jgi:NADPH-dependent F420 reductase
MKIAILGAGKVGGNLGKQWAAAGHTIVFGSRDPNSEKVKTLLGDIGPQASATSEADAVRDAEVVLLAVPYGAAQEVLANVGDLGGRVLIDATNALAQGGPAAPLSPASSAGLNVAGWAKNARVVKAFNTIGSAVMLTPQIDGRQVTVLYAGDDMAAKAVVRKLIQDIGFDAVDTGPLSNAYLLEAMCILWIDLARARGMGQVGFSLLRPS